MSRYSGRHHRPRTGPPPVALRLLIAPALLLTLVACSNTLAPADETAAPVAERTVAVDVHSLLDAMLDPADENSVSAALAALPRPLTTTTRSVPSLHAPGVTDHVASLAFGDVTVEVYQPGTEARALLSAVQLDTGALEFDGLRVGMDAAELYRRFGRPVVATPGGVAFRVTPSATTPYELTASLAGDTVTALRWSAYLD